MVKNLENKLKGPFQYNMSDVFVPLKLLRHLSKINRIKDPVIKYYEAGIITILTAAQTIMYYNLYESIK